MPTGISPPSPIQRMADGSAVLRLDGLATFESDEDAIAAGCSIGDVYLLAPANVLRSVAPAASPLRTWWWTGRRSS